MFCLHACLYTLCTAGYFTAHKRELTPLELELKSWAAIWVPGMKTRSCGRASSAPLSHHSSPYSNLCEEKTFKGIWESALPYVNLRRSRLSPQVHFKSLYCDINISTLHSSSLGLHSSLFLIISCFEKLWIQLLISNAVCSLGVMVHVFNLSTRETHAIRSL